MKKRLIFGLSIIMMCQVLMAQDEVVLDQVVGVVGKNIVKLSDVESAYSKIRIQRGIANAHSDRCNLFESMLINKLLVHKGEVDSVKVSDEQVNQMVQYYLEMYEMQYGTKEGIYKATGYTYEEMKDILTEQVREHKISQQVEYELTENVAITPGEVKAYYESLPQDSLPLIETRYEIAEITLQPAISEIERENVKNQLAQLRERVLKGEKFAMLATLYSQDPGSSKKGGELGFFTRDKMVPEFEAAAFALKPGEVSPIVETQFGYHIIQLIERRGNTINCRHILLTPKVSSGDMLKARVLLDSISLEIKSGRLTFEDAAKQYSCGPGKNQGGLVSNPNTGNNKFTKAEFESLFPGISIQNMMEGEISNATAMKTEENKDVYKLVKVTKKIEAHKANITDDYDAFYDAALAEAKQKKLLDWAAKMIKNTYIRIAPEFQDCNYKLNWLKK